jgi:hypothetical protein
LYARAEDRIDAHKILNRIDRNDADVREYVADVTYFLWAMTHRLRPSLIAQIMNIDFPEGF